MKLFTRNLPGLLLVTATIFMFSCKKGIDTQDPILPPGDLLPIPVSSPVTGSVNGMVLNENDAPVSGAQVKLGSSTTTTDANGIFNFSNVTLDKYISTLTVTNAGYYKAFRSFSATASRNYLSIKLIPKSLAGTVNGSASETVTLTNGTSISFQAGSILVKSTGALYSGTVNVYATYIDPTSSDISSLVPGSFMGKDADHIYVLQSTGMIAVDLETPGGEGLQLIPGREATVKLPIPASLLDKAPSTIDTWSLDEEGVWHKEGTAIRSGDHYEMKVTHFSFWNCDVPANAVYLSLHVQDQSGNPVRNVLVKLHIPNNTTWWATTYGHTDSSGNVGGLVPAAQLLQMSIFGNSTTCITPINSQNIGPFTADASLSVTVNLASNEQLTVSGTANGCNNLPLQNGIAYIHSGQYYMVTPVINGQYSATITHCSTISTVNVTVTDSNHMALNGSGNVTVTGNSVTIPVINVCPQNQQAVYTFGGAPGSCTGAVLTGTFTAGVLMNASNNVILHVNVTRLGHYSINTTNANGVSFSLSGTFFNLGVQDIILNASGMPQQGGAYNYNIIGSAAGTSACTFSVNYNPAGTAYAIINLGGPGACPNILVAGTYQVGVPLTSSNTLTLTVNVTNPGTYYINTGNPVNGIYFSDSGVVTQTGTQTIVLYGSGTPQAAGTFAFTASMVNGGQTCTVPISFAPATGVSVFTFTGGTGNCLQMNVLGTYTAGTALNAQNAIQLTVSVSLIGDYFITTNNADSISFSAGGAFTTTGIQNVLLTGSGVPISSGLFTFQTNSANGQGCLFTVPVN